MRLFRLNNIQLHDWFNNNISILLQNWCHRTVTNQIVEQSTLIL